MTQPSGYPAPQARPWRLTPAVGISLLLHAAAVATLIARPGLWPWIVGGLAVNHLLMFAAVLWPRGRILGPNWIRLPAAAAARNEISLTFDDGPDPEVTPKVLDLLDRYRAQASFFCVGEKAAAHPELVREIVRRGHSVENHSYCHSNTFAFYGLFRLRRDVESAQAVIAGISGQPPRYFRAPMGLRSPLLEPVLARCGLHYVSWTRRGYDATSRDPVSVLRRLAGTLAAGDILLLHDSGRSRTREGVPVVLAVLPKLLERMQENGLKSVTLTARWEMDLPVKLLLDAATRPYEGAGNFALHFARGKLRYDPVYFFLLRRGLLPDRGNLLDLGCGQGILLSLLHAAKTRHPAGAWPSGWPPPPLNLTLQGIELDPDRAGSAQRALVNQARVTQQDVRDAAFPPCSAVVLLDVLLYLKESDQLRVLEKAAAALESGGLLLLREADAGAGFAFRVTRWSERMLEILRGRLRDRLHYRGAVQWTGLLEALGFTVTVELMSAGTPFANVLFHCRKRDRG